METLGGSVRWVAVKGLSSRWARAGVWLHASRTQIATPHSTSISEPRAFLREAPVWKKHTPKLVPIWPKKLPQHVGAMSWHHAKFHNFQACFGFTGIKKPKFSIFPVEPRRPDVWISFPFLAWDLEIHPRTQMWFFKQLWCNAARACCSNLNYAH